MHANSRVFAAALGLTSPCCPAPPALAKAMARAGLQLSCEGLDCVDKTIRLWDLGISLDADGRDLGIPVGLMVRGRSAAGGDDLGAGVFWLGRRLRVGLELRAFVDNSELSASWPDAEWNLRVDWLGEER